jgi:hypothetical protein
MPDASSKLLQSIAAGQQFERSAIDSAGSGRSNSESCLREVLESPPETSMLKASANSKLLDHLLQRCSIFQV